MEEKKKKLALLAVYEKLPELIEFAVWLIDHGFDLVASSGTAKYLQKADIAVQDVAEFVGGGPILGHRVVTLSREMAAALLCRRDNADDMAEMRRLNIRPIDLVFVTLYPMREAINRPSSTREDVIELTDIGGPTLIREAAKGRRIVLTGYDQVQRLMDSWLILGGFDGLSSDEGLDIMVAGAERTVAQYCADSADYHSDGEFKAIFGELAAFDTYGENRWQSPCRLFELKGADYDDDPLSIHNLQLISGPEPGYINLTDIDRALQTTTHIRSVFQTANVGVAVKHGNPVGASFNFSSAANPDLAEQVVWGDPLSIFGGIVLFNCEVTLAMAEALLTYRMPEGQKRIIEGVVAPFFSPDALTMLARSGGKKCKLWTPQNPIEWMMNFNLDCSPRFRSVRGGLLTEPNYTFVMDLRADYIEVHGERGCPVVENGLLLAWAVGSTSNSNTITIARHNKIISNGVGQQDRVGAAELAIELAKRSGHDLTGTVAYSDSFFPFPDGIETLASAGIRSVLASSGSKNDKQVIARAKELGMTLYLVPDSMGRGFFGH